MEVNNTPVASVDLDRYLGTWYEIARIDHRFEKDLVAVQAQYRLKENGKIEVRNSGHKFTVDGEYKEAIGKAYQPDLNQPGLLRVSFFLWFYSDYRILELDADYRYVLVGGSNEDYLWILSRTPTLSEAVIQDLYRKAQARGYSTDRLMRVPQVL
ncbi:MAG: lipocalin family protein [Bacteroidales bacterium]|nr:lipocalin family protein [Bacteroidales bacterium]MDD3166974.1 lipocalin family protein [Bacteroidales bacterium]MDD4769971.1 lipocalin family protein [Bacteroidales bacterium]